MKRKELEHKYGKKLINKIFTGDYLNGCTIAIVDGEDDIPESDIIRSIREIKDEKVIDWD